MLFQMEYQLKFVLRQVSQLVNPQDNQQINHLLNLVRNLQLIPQENLLPNPATHPLLDQIDILLYSLQGNPLFNHHVNPHVNPLRLLATNRIMIQQLIRLVSLFLDQL